MYGFYESYRGPSPVAQSTTQSAANDWGPLVLNPYLAKCITFQQVIIVIAKRIIPLSHAVTACTMAFRERSQWLRRDIVRGNGKINSRKDWLVLLLPLCK